MGGGGGGSFPDTYGGIFLPRGSQIAVAIIFLIFQKIKSFPENIIAITSII